MGACAFKSPREDRACRQVEHEMRFKIKDHDCTVHFTIYPTLSNATYTVDARKLLTIRSICAVIKCVCRP